MLDRLRSIFPRWNGAGTFYCPRMGWEALQTPKGRCGVTNCPLRDRSGGKTVELERMFADRGNGNGFLHVRCCTLPEDYRLPSTTSEIRILVDGYVASVGRGS